MAPVDPEGPPTQAGIDGAYNDPSLPFYGRLDIFLFWYWAPSSIAPASSPCPAQHSRAQRPSGDPSVHQPLAPEQRGLAEARYTISCSRAISNRRLKITQIAMSCKLGRSQASKQAGGQAGKRVRGNTGTQCALATTPKA